MIQNALNLEGELVNVKDANKGLECNLRCSCCNESVVAKQGRQKEWHFAHVSGSECQYAKESELHHLAKKIIEQNKQLKIPYPYEFFNSKKNRYELKYKFFLLEVSDVFLEKRMNGIISDIICKIKESEIAIEIFVTHKIDSIKEQKINEMGITTLEINLSNSNRWIDELHLKEILIEKQIDYSFKYFCNKKEIQLKDGIAVKNKIIEDMATLQREKNNLKAEKEQFKREVSENRYTIDTVQSEVSQYRDRILSMKNEIYYLEHEISTIKSSREYEEALYRKCCEILPIAYQISNYFMYGNTLICLSDINSLPTILLFLQKEMKNRVYQLKCLIHANNAIGFIWTEDRYKLVQEKIVFENNTWDIFGNYINSKNLFSNMQKSLF